MQQKEQPLSRRALWAKIIVTVLLTLLLLAGIITSTAEYASRGNYKDVLPSREYFFSSNILKRAGSGTIPVFNSHAMMQDVTVFNYDTATLQYNEFTVEYNISFEICGQTVNENYSYAVEYTVGDTTETVYLTAAQKSATLTAERLMGDTLSMRSYRIVCANLTPGDTGITEAAGDPNPVEIRVTPTAPDSMLNFVMVGRISFSNTAFKVTGSFDVPQGTTDLTAYAGFLYRILRSGNPLEDERVTVRWDAAALAASPSTLDRLQELGITVENDSGTWQKITFSPTVNLQNLAFFRVTEDDPGTENVTEGFDATVIQTPADLAALVEIGVIVVP